MSAGVVPQEPVVHDFVYFYLMPHEIPHIKSMVKWFYIQGIIPEMTADSLGRYAMAKLSQEYQWMTEAVIKEEAEKYGGRKQ